MRTSLAAAAVCAALALPAAAQELAFWDAVAGWDILVDPTLGNGCLIQAEYDHGALVRIGFDTVQGMGYVSAFHADRGDVVEGETYPVAFDLDGQAYEGEATGLWLDGVPGVDILFDSEDFLWDLAARQTMTLFNEAGEVMAIDLGGTMAALTETIACQEAQG